MGQFKALFTKNWILYKRSWLGSFMELVIPIVFVAFVFMLRNLSVIIDYPETQFVGLNLTYLIPENNTMITGMLKKCGSRVVALVSPNVTLPDLQVALWSYGYNTRIFASDAELDALVRHPLYTLSPDYPRVCFGISLLSGSPNYSYKLRYNVSSDFFSGSDGPSTIAPSTLDLYFDSTTIYYPIVSGMLVINNLIHNLILRAETGDDNKILTPVIAPMKQQAYHDDQIYLLLGNSMDMLCLLPLLIVYLRQISSMLTEKEKKIRETMKIMGMKGGIYYLTWFIRYLCVYATIHLVASGIICKAFPNINFGVIFLTFILFDMVLIIQGFFIQVFFTKSKIGMVFGLLLFTVQFVANFLVRNSDNPTFQQALYGSFSPHSAFVSALRLMLYCESLQIPLSFSNATKQINFYNLSVCWISCSLHIVFWILVTYYLEQVFPNEWGAKEHPCFCFKNMCPHSRVVDEQTSEAKGIKEEDVEEVEQRYKEMEIEQEVVRLIGVNKEFDGKKKRAVRDLNLTIYNDQIFVLLGHNGAGKTTTISMLTGLLQPTSGRIIALGHDLSTQMSEVRKQMGICPQHDTLYDDLTVKEHLELFATFKNFDSNELDEEVNKLIKDVNLDEKADYLSKELSGGQKRRLSVALAFVGGSKLIYLDEPTSGMDTSARRYIWQMMKNYKNDRIIILTTHFMDEADFLGDRISIMSDGKLVCSGSTMFLKNRFGVGYNITLVKKDIKVPSEPIVNTIKKHVNKCKVTTDVSSEVAVQLPMEEVDKFPKLFDELDARKRELGFESYGVSITTLEEVFLKVAQSRKDYDEEEEEQLEENFNKARLPAIGSDRTLQSNEHPVERDERCKFFRHLKAILVKKFRVTYRDWKMMAYEFIIPIGIIVLAMFLMRISFVTDPPDQTINLDIFKSEGLPLAFPVSGNDTAGNITTIVNRLNTDFSGKLSAAQYSSASVQAFDNNTLFPQKHAGQLKGGLFLSNTASTLNYLPYFLLNTRSQTTPLLFPTLYTQSLTNTLIANPITITLINSPFPRTYQALQINNAISGFLGAFIFSMALAFKFASFISFLVKQREDKCKHQQIVSGMKIASYWFGNFVFDYFMYLMVAMLAAGLCIVFEIKSMVEGDAMLATWLLFALYGMANIPFTYVSSFLFTDYGNSQAAFYFFNFVAGAILPTVVLVLRLIGDETAIVGKAIAWLFRLIPAYSFGEGLLNQGSLALLSLRENFGKNYSIFQQQITLTQPIFLGLEAILFFLILFLIETLNNNEKFLRFFSKQQKIPDTQEDKNIDEDVLAEVMKVQLAAPEDYTILTKDLRKVYLLGGDKHKVAVDRLNFTVSKGEVFGLLGVNGAGKTTTFKMLAGQVTSTSGEAYFNGLRISDNLDQIRRTLGYCPQFDALLQNLTVRQQLELYYDMKSLPSDSRQHMISAKIEELNLGRYQKVLSGTLSGGNKRKLSVACAIIGDPSIVFLDEPSTGMDPQARRFMWRIISSIATVKRQSTIILTTHSMEEAEALSTRLGIMVKGNFRCLGTPQHIKSKYGEGYELEVKIHAPIRQAISARLSKTKLQEKDTATSQTLPEMLKTLTNDQFIISQVTKKGSGKYLLNKIKDQGKVGVLSVLEFVMIEECGKQVNSFIGKRLGSVEQIEHFQTFYRFRLKSGTPIGRIFGLLEENKKALNIQQYSIKQATVEQIFNMFASKYEEGEQT